MSEGLFIVFEGINGCGKTEQAHLLARHIVKLDKSNQVLLTSEPTENAGKIEKRLEKERDPYSHASKMAELYVEDRVQHTNEVIIPNLERGVHVVCSRYRMSTEGYQSAQGKNLDELIEMQNESRILTADITFFLDIDSGTSLKRTGSGKSIDKFEGNPDFVDALIRQYKKCIKLGRRNTDLYGRIVVVNGKMSVESVSKTVNRVFSGFYNSLRE